MERLPTKRTLARVDLQKLSDELMMLRTTDDLEPEQEDRIAEIRAEMEVIAKDLKHQDALIDPHVSDDDFAEECAGVRKYQALITRMRTRLEPLQRKSLSDGEVIGDEEVTIHPFGGAANVMKSKRRLVRVRLRSQYSRKEHCVEALEVEEICSEKLVLPDDVHHLPGAAGLQLADVAVSPTRGDRKDIDVLIGADSYWRIVSGEVRAVEERWSRWPRPSYAPVCGGAGVQPFPTSSRAFWELESLGISTKDGPWGDDEHRFTSDGVENPCSASEAATSEVTPVLGLEWNRESDELRYPLRTVLELVTVNRKTKRFVLQASARIFDPLGLVGPVTITTKMLFQELWTLGLEWDALLPPGVSERWEKWIDNLHHLTAITLPRRYACQMEAAELHIFTDASPRAYGAVAYLRGERDGKTTVTLILAKTRVAPLKTLSLPRLELLGTVLGARMCANLR
ncbi:hypothetical protein MTO96_036580 [Rhipicephalus appendiculatus]